MPIFHNETELPCKTGKHMLTQRVSEVPVTGVSKKMSKPLIQIISI